MSGFVKTRRTKIRNNSITPSQQAEAEERLGARIDKYTALRKNGMSHRLALAEAVKP